MTPSDDLKTSFERDGYVHIPGFLTADEVTAIKNKLADFISEVVPYMPAEDVFYEDEKDPSTLKQMFNLSRYDPYFEGLLTGSRFGDLAEVLLGEKMAQGHVEYFNKPAGVGQPTPPHQDCYYFMLTPPQALTFWLPLEDVDRENGCLHYIKGSHRKGMRVHGRTSTLGFSQGIVDFGTAEDRENEVIMPVKAGDVLIHHGMTVHLAEGNQSRDRARKVMGFVYFGESAREDVAAKLVYQEKLRLERSAEDQA